jgi:hypothetical protein
MSLIRTIQKLKFNKQTNKLTDMVRTPNNLFAYENTVVLSLSRSIKVNRMYGFSKGGGRTKNVFVGAEGSIGKDI